VRISRTLLWKELGLDDSAVLLLGLGLLAAALLTLGSGLIAGFALLGALLVHGLQGPVDDGQGAQAVEVEFHQPGLFHPFHVELGCGHVRARVLVERHQRVDRAVADHFTHLAGFLDARMDEFLPAKTGVYGHDQHHIQQVHAVFDCG
jgi:hypothetical protein